MYIIMNHCADLSQTHLIFNQNQCVIKNKTNLHMYIDGNSRRHQGTSPANHNLHMILQAPYMHVRKQVLSFGHC